MKNLNHRLFYFFAFVCCIFLFLEDAKSQIVQVGSGSYTRTFPEPTVPARRERPRGANGPAIPNVTSNMANKKIPSNTWWSTLIWTTGGSTSHGFPFYNYPLSFRSRPNGLAMEYTVPPSGARGSIEPMSAVYPVISGVQGLNTGSSLIDNYSDWTVTAFWGDASRTLRATVVMGSPFTYYEKTGSSPAQITVNMGQVTISGNTLIIRNTMNGANFAVYAPAGSSWTQSGSTYTSTLNGRNYWSIAMLPPGIDVNTAVNNLRQYAYVFPGNTQVSWSYNSTSSTVRTTFTVTPVVKEGNNNNFLQGLLPHQWTHLANDSGQPTGYRYPSVRGQIRTLPGNSFIVENKFNGILPTLPSPGGHSSGFSTTQMNSLLNEWANDQLYGHTDSYNQGKDFGKYAQLIRIADQFGNTAVRNHLLSGLRTRLENWLTASPGELEFLFYYDQTWNAMLGFPAGHGQDYNLNDHHFHWAYFIHAACVIEQFNPGWAQNWGGMIELLIRDANSWQRNDPLFPFLRNFDPYAGHSWANGSGSFPQGNDQESSSESMQFHSAIIHWAMQTGNTQLRDLGIYLYTTEQSAIEEYWWNVNGNHFKPGYAHEAAARVWGAGYDMNVFWTGDIAPTWGINFLPIHGGSLYLGKDPAVVNRLWGDITRNTGILAREQNPNLWHDIYWSYLAFANPAEALRLYNNFPNYPVEFGESRAHTYHWLHGLNALGQVDASITANYPIAAVFNKNGTRTYVAHNYSNTARTVTFSNGQTLNVPARSMATSRSGDNPPPPPPPPPGSAVRIQAQDWIAMSGVQTEPTSDVDGVLNVGWIDAGDWMAYNITIPTAGTYTVSYRVASPNSGRTLRLERNSGAINLGTVNIPNTGNWQSWTTVSHQVELPAGTYSVGIATSTGGFNINWFEIAGQEPCNPTTIVPYLSVNGGNWQQTSSATLTVGGSITFGPQPLQGGSWSWTGPNGFTANTREVTRSNIQANQAGNYTTTYTNSCGATSTHTFNVVVNQPGFSVRIEAENYDFMSGVQVEACSEGGQNVGWIDAGDWMAYNVSIPASGTYTVSYRVASPHSGRTLRLERNSGAINLGTVNIPNTGNWQSWTTVSHQVSLPAGNYTLGIATSTGGFNLNWFEIRSASSARMAEEVVVNKQKDEDISDEEKYEDNKRFLKNELIIYPNPAQDILYINFGSEKVTEAIISNAIGKTFRMEVNNGTLDIAQLKPGLYLLSITAEKKVLTRKFIKK